MSRQRAVVDVSSLLLAGVVIGWVVLDGGAGGREVAIAASVGAVVAAVMSLVTGRASIDGGRLGAGVVVVGVVCVLVLSGMFDVPMAAAPAFLAYFGVVAVFDLVAVWRRRGPEVRGGGG